MKCLGEIPTNDKPMISHDKPISKVYECVYCGNEYMHYQSRFRHEKMCSKKYCQNDSQIIEMKDKLLEEKDHIISEMGKQIEMLITKVGSNNNNNVTININAYGNENIEYLTESIIKKIINAGPFVAIPKLIREIHYNPEHKENQNLLITNQRSKYVKKYNGSKWEFADKKPALQSMADKVFYILLENSDGTKFKKFANVYEDQDDNLIKDTLNDTEKMILNSQDLSVL